MKKKFNQKMILALAAGSLSLSGFLVSAPVVFARADGMTELSPVASSTMEVSINKSGHAKLVGTLSAVSGSTLTINSYGGAWTIDTSKAKLIRRFGAASSVAEFQIGDLVTINGEISTGAWTITAKEVRDESIKARNSNPIGVLSNLNTVAGTFTLTNKAGKVFQISTASSTPIRLNSKSGPATLTDLSNGMTVQVWGVENTGQSTIAATRVAASLKRISLNGIISGPANNSFLLTNANHATTTVTLVDKAKITVNGRGASFGNLTSGMTANVTGFALDSNSSVTASIVTARTARLIEKRD